MDFLTPIWIITITVVTVVYYCDYFLFLWVCLILFYFILMLFRLFKYDLLLEGVEM